MYATSRRRLSVLVAGIAVIASALVAPSAALAVGGIQPGTYAPTTSLNVTTHTATVALSGTPVTPQPLTASYQWYRDRTLIVGATAASYTLTTADAGRGIRVVVMLSKAGYADYTYAGVVANSIAGSGTTTITSLPDPNVHQGYLTCHLPTLTLADGSPFVLGSGGSAANFQWYVLGFPVQSGGNSQTFTYVGPSYPIDCSAVVSSPWHSSRQVGYGT